MAAQYDFLIKNVNNACISSADKLLIQAKLAKQKQVTVFRCLQAIGKK